MQGVEGADATPTVGAVWLGLNEVQAILITAAFATVIAFWGVISQRQISRRQATLLHIERTESDGDLIAARREFIRLGKINGGLQPWAEDGQQQTAEAQAIRLVLNEFELISIGIQRGVIDFRFYAWFFRTNTQAMWGSAKPYVERLRARTGRDTFYREFEKLAQWMKDGRPPLSAYIFGMFF